MKGADMAERARPVLRLPHELPEECVAAACEVLLGVMLAQIRAETDPGAEAEVLPLEDETERAA